MLNNFLYAFLMLLLCFICTPEKLNATHAAGAQLTVEHVSGNTYNVVYTFYRDCNGVNAPTNLNIDVSSVNCGINSQLTLLNTTSTEITHPCVSAVSTCNGGTVTGIQKYIYEATITLDSACSDWVFSHDLCCRNHSITTLSNPGNENIYIETHFNNLNVNNNSTPLFNNDPILFTCLNQSFTYNNGVVDVDGDSLVFSFADPMHLAGTPVVYNPGFSAINPLTTSTGFSINAQTGEISFTPSALGIGVIVVRVDEYRNGVLISSVFRDMQIYVDACTGNSLPTLSGVNNTTNYSISIPANQNTCFNVVSQDLDTADVLTLIWNNGIPQGTFNVLGGNQPVGQFCWTPTFADTLQNPHIFTVLVLDDNCPLNGAQVYTYSVTVYNDSSFYCNINGTNPLCFGDSNGYATVNAFQGVAPYSFLWNNGDTNSVISNIIGGVYNVLVVDSINDTSTCMVTIVEPAALSISLINTNPTCINMQDGSISSAVTGGNGPYTFEWSNGVTSSSIANLGSGLYIVTVTDQNQCSSNASSQLQISNTLTCNIYGTNITCNGLNNGSITALVSGGAGNYIYNWSNGASTISLQNLSAGIYTVTVSEVGSCTVTGSIQITEPSPINLNIYVTNASCFGLTNGTASITTSGGLGAYSYQWSNGLSTSNANSLNAGIYTVTVTDGNACSSSGHVVISEPLQISTQLSINDVSCFGANDGSANVVISGGIGPYNYNWYYANSLVSNQNMSPGVYSIQVVDANGCSYSQGFIVSEPAVLTLGISSSDVSCFGLSDGTASANGGGGTTPYQYLWSNGVTSQHNNSLSDGWYVVTIIDDNACTVSASVQISGQSAIISNLTTTNVICNSTSTGTAQVSVTGGVGNFTYNWSNGSTMPTANSLIAGLYTLTILDGNNCSNTSAFIISEPTAISVSVISNDVVCYGDSSGSSNAIVYGGTSPYSYNWISGSIPVNPNYLPFGNYILEVIDSNGCMQSENFSISQPSELVLASISNNIQCHGDDNGSIQTAVTGGVFPYEYLWSNGTSGQSLDSLPGGIYLLTITDLNSCTVEASINIIEPLPLILNINSDTTICYAGEVALNAEVSGGTGTNYQILWNGNSLSGLGPHIVNFYQDSCINVLAIDTFGCTSDYDTVCIEVQPPLDVNVNAIDSICYGDTVTLSAFANGGNGGPYYYNWLWIGTDSVVTVVPDAYPGSATYIISVSDSCSPTVFDTVDVFFHTMPHDNIMINNHAGCAPLQLEVINNSTNTSNCYWSMGTGDSIFSCNSFIYEYSTPGEYTLSVFLESDKGCFSSVDSMLMVSVYSYPKAHFKFTPLNSSIQNPKFDFYNNSVDAVSYEWHFGDGDISYEEHPSHVYSDTGLYTVMLIVENEWGCRDTHYSKVMVHMNLIVHMPNSFSPNFDGHNDYFFPKGVGINSEGYELQIYNRWGDLVYLTNEPNGNWDGTVKHSPNRAQQGVYVYLLTVRDYKMQPYYLSGTVTLIK